MDEQSGGSVKLLTAVADPTPLQPVSVSYLPMGLALGRLQKLHRRAAGEATGDAGIDSLTAAKALTLVSNGIVSILGQIAAIEPLSADSMLAELCAYANTSGLGGLHPVFLAAFSSSRRLGETSAQSEAVAIWNETGLPRQLPGGALTMPLLDAVNDRLSLVGALQIASAFGVSAHNYRTFLTSLDLLSDASSDPDIFRSGLFTIGLAIAAAADAVAGTALVGQPAPAPSETELIIEGDPPAAPLNPQARLVELLAHGKALIVNITRNASDPLLPPGGDTSGLTLAPSFAIAGESGDGEVWRAREVESRVVKSPESEAHLLVQSGRLVLRALTRLRRDRGLTGGGLITSFRPVNPSDLSRAGGGMTSGAEKVQPVGFFITFAPQLDPLTGLPAWWTYPPGQSPPPWKEPLGPETELELVTLFETERTRLGLPSTATVGDVVNAWRTEVTATLTLA